MSEFDFVSVVIPTYNRCHLLAGCLESFNAQTCGTSSFEVIVVDDGSEDDTPRVVEEFKRISSYELIYVAQRNKGPAGARNNGIARAKGYLVAFTDDDCIVDRNWISEFLRSFDQNDIGGVGGSVRSRANGLLGAFMIHEGVLEPLQRGGRILYLVTANACFRRDLLVKAGGFEEHIRNPGGEDPALSFKILELGYELKFNPYCIVYHHFELNLKDFLRKFYNYGRGASYIANTLRTSYLDPPSVDLWLIYLTGIRLAKAIVGFRRGDLSYRTNLAYSILRIMRDWAYRFGFKLGYISDHVR